MIADVRGADDFAAVAVAGGRCIAVGNAEAVAAAALVFEC